MSLTRNACFLSLAAASALTLLCVAGFASAAETPAAAAAVSPATIAKAASAGAISLEVDKAELLHDAGPGATVFVANPDIADAQAPDARRVVVLGKKPGQTTVYLFGRDGSAASYAVTVRRPVEDIAASLRALVPGATVEVSRGPGGMTVTGRAPSPSAAETLKTAAQQQLTDKETLNFNVAVEGPTQVNLQVRVAEVSRQVTNTLGFNWNALFNNGTVAVGVLTGRQPASGLGNFNRDVTGSQFGSIGFGYSKGSVNMSALVDALQANGLVTVLAEPNLTAISGATANFLAGGEFPVPVAQGLQQISIEWKKFGVSVDFTPTVLDPNRISIRVRPEVSELSDNGAVVVNNIRIPSIAVRRAETTVELASGQSFAIAGLFKNNMSKSVQQYPGLGQLPVLGALFRSSGFKHDQTELVIIVTPYIVRPADHPSDLHTPLETVAYSNDLEQILLGKLTADAPSKDARPHLAGPAGFMLEEKP